MSFRNDIEKLDDWAVCPYDPNHQMYYRKLATHLTGCRERNPRKAELISICVYNRTHHVPTDKMAEHLVVCRSYQEVAATDFRRTMQNQPEDPKPRPLSKSEKRLLKEEAELSRKQNEEWIDEEEEGKEEDGEEKGDESGQEASEDEESSAPN